MGLKDLKPKKFPTVEAFLKHAINLIQERRVVWDTARQTGHDVSQAEAEQIVFWAKPADCKEHWTLPGHYLVWGPDRRNRVIRVWAVIGDAADGGEALGLEAFEEYRKFGA